MPCGIRIALRAYAVRHTACLRVYAVSAYAALAPLALLGALEKRHAPSCLSVRYLPSISFKRASQPSRISSHVISKLPVYHGSATDAPFRAV